jgi:uncharacterized membrane protein
MCSPFTPGKKYFHSKPQFLLGFGVFGLLLAFGIFIFQQLSYIYNVLWLALI